MNLVSRRRFRRDRISLLLVAFFFAWSMTHQAWAGYPVSVVHTERMRWQAHVRVLGEVRSLSRAILRTSVTGRVGRFPLPEGSYVKAGRLLGRVIPPDLAARIKAARSRLHLAHDMLGHDRALYGQRLLTRGTFQGAANRVAVDQDRLHALELALSQTRLVAPVSGTVHYLVVPGTEVTAGTAVIRLGGASRVWVRAFVTPSAAGLLHAGELARLQMDGQPKKRAEVISIGVSARNDGLVEIFLRPSDRGFLPGEWLWVDLPTTSGYGWRVPRPALVMRGSHARVFVLGGHRANPVPVTVLHVNRHYVWLRGALHPGEPVIVKGAGAVSDKTAVTVEAATSLSGR